MAITNSLKSRTFIAISPIGKSIGFIKKKEVKTKLEEDELIWLKKYFRFTKKGNLIAYKAFGYFHDPPDKWKIKKGNFIEEEVDLFRSKPCSFGINVATIEWIKTQTYPTIPIWKIKIMKKDFDKVCVPFNTDGKFRCGRCKLIDLIQKEPKVNKVRKIKFKVKKSKCRIKKRHCKDCKFYQKHSRFCRLHYIQDTDPSEILWANKCSDYRKNKKENALYRKRKS